MVFRQRNQKDRKGIILYKILVLGALNIDQYTKDGENRTFTKVIANKIEFLDSKKDNSNSMFEASNDDIPFQEVIKWLK